VKCEERMVDYYVPVSHSVARDYRYVPSNAYREDHHGGYVFQQTSTTTEDRPLNLSLNPDRNSGSSTTSIICNPETMHVPPPGFLSVDGELGNVFIVSDLDCAIAKEEVVEAVDHQEEVYDALQHMKVEEEDNDDESSISDSEEYSEYDNEVSRNLFLKSKFNDLSNKVAKIRDLIQTQARNEKSKIVVVPIKTEAETEVEIRSEGELEHGEVLVPGIKRSRNHSWPQMTAISSNQRKKEQNKLASKRFRERKKMELTQARMDITELEVRNCLLTSKANSIQAEADNLRKILLDLQLIKVVELPSGHSTIVKIEK